MYLNADEFLLYLNRTVNTLKQEIGTIQIDTSTVRATHNFPKKWTCSQGSWATTKLDLDWLMDGSRDCLSIILCYFEFLGIAIWAALNRSY